MKKTLLTVLSVAGMVAPLFAQEATERPAKKINHHVGVQINELIRQVFNFSNTNTSANNNPYLLVYSANSARSGWGGRLGIGYTYRSFTDDDGITRRESDINSMQLRLGVEKAFTLSEKWSVGIGIDGLWNKDNNKTNSLTKGTDTTLVITKTDVSSYGGGAMGWLRYNITNKVVIGTETSFYYVTGNQKQDISITSKVFGQVTTQVSPIDNKLSEGVFRMPVAIYLLVKF